MMRFFWSYYGAQHRCQARGIGPGRYCRLEIFSRVDAFPEMDLSTL